MAQNGTSPHRSTGAAAPAAPSASPRGLAARGRRRPPWSARRCSRPRAPGRGARSTTSNSSARSSGSGWRRSAHTCAQSIAGRGHGRPARVGTEHDVSRLLARRCSPQSSWRRRRLAPQRRAVAREAKPVTERFVPLAERAVPDARPHRAVTLVRINGGRPDRRRRSPSPPAGSPRRRSRAGRLTGAVHRGPPPLLGGVGPRRARKQRTHFFKNVSLPGGLLIAARRHRGQARASPGAPAGPRATPAARPATSPAPPAARPGSRQPSG